MCTESTNEKPLSSKGVIRYFIVIIVIGVPIETLRAMMVGYFGGSELDLLLTEKLIVSSELVS